MYSPPDFYLPTHERFAPLYIAPDIAQNLLSDRLICASTLDTELE
jgi:hypothetical protein